MYFIVNLIFFFCQTLATFYLIMKPQQKSLTLVTPKPCCYVTAAQFNSRAVDGAICEEMSLYVRERVGDGW